MRPAQLIRLNADVMRERFRTVLISARAKRACASLMLMVAAICFFLAPLLITRLGYQGNAEIIHREITELELDLASLQGLYDGVTHVEQKYDVLAQYSLPRRSFETHTECLVRGAHHVNSQFLSHEFLLLPDLGNRTVKWVQESCDTHFFTPAVWKHRSASAPELGLLRERMKRAYTIAKWKVQTWFSSFSATAATALAPSERPRTQYALSPLFALTDCEPAPCHLSFVPLPIGHDLVAVRQEDIDASQGRIKNLRQALGHHDVMIELSRWYHDVLLAYAALLLFAWQCMIDLLLLLGLLDSSYARAEDIPTSLLISVTLEALATLIKSSIENTKGLSCVYVRVALLTVGYTGLLVSALCATRLFLDGFDDFVLTSWVWLVDTCSFMVKEATAALARINQEGQNSSMGIKERHGTVFASLVDMLQKDMVKEATVTEEVNKNQGNSTTMKHEGIEPQGSTWQLVHRSELDSSLDLAEVAAAHPLPKDIMDDI